MAAAKWRTIGCLLLVLVLAGTAAAQKDEEGPVTELLTFLVIKEDNGKPIRNAAVIMHPVSADGKQSRGGLELKTNNDGRTSFDDVPYGKLRVRLLLASGFGEDYDVDKAKLDLTIKLKRPQGQYSIYENHPEEKKDDKTPAPPIQTPSHNN